MCIRDSIDDDPPAFGGHTIHENVVNDRAVGVAHQAVARIADRHRTDAVSYTHLRAHETVLDLVCRLLLEKKKQLILL